MGKQTRLQQKEFLPPWLKLYGANLTILGEANLQALKDRFYRQNLHCLTYSERQAVNRFFQILTPKANVYVPLLPQLRPLDHFNQESALVIHLKEAGAKRHFVLINETNFTINGRQITCIHEGESFEVDILSPFVFTWREYQFLKKNHKYAEIMAKAFRRKNTRFAADKYLINLRQSALTKEKLKPIRQLSAVSL